MMVTDNDKALNVQDQLQVKLKLLFVEPIDINILAHLRFKKLYIFKNLGPYLLNFILTLI